MASSHSDEAGDGIARLTAPTGLSVPRAPSVGGISSQVVDMASEDGEFSQAPTGQSSLPLQSRASTSRRGPGGVRTSIASRPGTSASRVSKTHIPSMAAQGFFRPMSSQLLQAHRGGRPATKRDSLHSEEMAEQLNLNRRSLVSNSTIMQGSIPQSDLEVPPSRGTEFTDPIIPDRGTSNASPTGNTHTTVRSLGESVRLLKDREDQYRSPSQQLGLRGNQNGNGDSHGAPQRPLHGFPTMQNKNVRHERQDSRAERWPSSASAGSSPESLDVKRHHNPHQRNLGRNYEYFTGNTVFCGGGRLQNSRDKPINIATGIFVLLPSGLFFGYSAPWLWRNISPAIPLVFAYLFYICFSSFVHASVVDPGIIPRNIHPMPSAEPPGDPLAVGPPTNDWVMVKLATSEVAAMDVPVKYCKTCNIWRPPRCYHCRVCDNCVETLDHHCVWLNNCVGRRNYRYFFAFVSSATLLAFYLIGASLAHILVYSSREAISFGTAIGVWKVPFAMVIYGALAGPYPASLWAYHLFLVGRGETTREYLNSHKFAKPDRHRPFTQGNMFKNWTAVLMRPRPPTYLEFKRAYQEGDQRLGAEKRKHRPRDVEAQAGIEMQYVRSDHQG